MQGDLSRIRLQSNIPRIVQQSSYTTRPASVNGRQINHHENNYDNIIRSYAERLKEEKQISLKYLQQVTQLSDELRSKQQEIMRLNKLNRQLEQKLTIYESVLTRSRPANPMRMSTVISKSHMMMESFLTVEKSEQLQQNSNQKFIKINLFEQFFIVSPGSSPTDPISYHYKYNQQSNQKLQQCIRLYLQHPQFVLKMNQTSSNMKSGNKRILFLANSPLTTDKEHQKNNLPILIDLNPSYYYYGFCLLQKELISVNGKYFWAPVVYGFLTYYPFPQFFLRSLQTIVKEYTQFKNNESLTQSLKSINVSWSQVGTVNGKQNLIQLPAQMKYSLFNKTYNFKLPPFEQLQSLTLDYSKDIFKNYSIQLVVDVLLLLLLQIPITVISIDVELLGKFMIYFICLIRPLKYPFPIVFCLPPPMEALLQPPFPTFLGSTDIIMVEKYINERAVFDLDQKVARSWPILPHLDIARNYLINLIEKRGNNSIQKSQIIRQIIQGQKTAELAQYWKDFSKTQIYQIFICEQ